MKKLILLLLVVYSVNLYSQTYQISFAATGASTTIDTVKVENLTQNTSLTMKGSDILNLNVTTGIFTIDNPEVNNFTISPNPVIDKSYIELFTRTSGNATFELIDICGRMITKSEYMLNNGKHKFEMSIGGTGIYFLKVISNNYVSSAKIISNSVKSGNAEIRLIASESSESNSKTEQKVLDNLKSINSLINMAYTTGDQLKLTGRTGVNRDIVFIMPKMSQTVKFLLKKGCGDVTDKDGNVYATVQIGSQCWMKENLRTTHYSISGGNSGLHIMSDSTRWGNVTAGLYCYYDNDENNGLIYGCLYNGAAEISSYNICPTAWHVPSYDEWETLTANYGGDANAAGALRATGTIESGTGLWHSPSTGSTNSSGFSAIPGGERYFSQSNDVLYLSLSDASYLWTSTEETGTAFWGSSLTLNTFVNLLDFPSESGFSVRCLKN